MLVPIWDINVISGYRKMSMTIQLGIIGDFESDRPSHIATNEALKHCADFLNIDIFSQWLPTETLEQDADARIRTFDAIWSAPGIYKNSKGVINAIRAARQNDMPFVGTCNGFQHAVMEYALNVLGMPEVNHQERNPDAAVFFITALSCPLTGASEKVYLSSGSVIRTIYGKDEIEERYNCNFGLNICYQEVFEQSGFRVAGVNDKNEVRIFEMLRSRFYIATLFQPQLGSTREHPHELILNYLLAAKQYHDEKRL